MTDKQDPIAHAARLLREAAEELRQAHAYNNSEGWENETDAKAAYDEHLAAAQALEDWEAAVGAGGVSGPLMGIAAPPTAQAEGWTKLPGQLPEPGMPVLLDIGKKYPIRALWAAKNTVRVGTDVDDWGEYDEETDEYYCPEGWYEWNEHEEVHWAVSETPRAWSELPQPLPAAPGPADGDSNG